MATRTANRTSVLLALAAMPALTTPPGAGKIRNKKAGHSFRIIRRKLRGIKRVQAMHREQSYEP